MFPTLHRYAIIATVALAALIVLLTLTPSNSIPAPVFGDKIAHFLAFTALVVPLVSVRLHNAFWVIPIAIIFGGAIELIQPMVNRQTELGDFIADIAGAVFALFPAYFIHKILVETKTTLEIRDRSPYKK